MTDRLDPIVAALLLAEAVASIRLDNDDRAHTFTIDDADTNHEGDTMTGITLSCPDCGATFNADQEFVARIIRDRHMADHHATTLPGQARQPREGEPS